MKKKMGQYKPFKAGGGEVLRPIRLEVRLNNLILRDQFMWDINNPSNSPEQFASTLIADLGLGSEFFLPVAHSIREQIHAHRQSLPPEAFYKSAATAADHVPKPPSSSDIPDLSGVFRSIAPGTTNIIVNYHGHEQENLGALWSPTIQQLTEDEFRKY